MTNNCKGYRCHVPRGVQGAIWWRASACVRERRLWPTLSCSVLSVHSGVSATSACVRSSSNSYSFTCSATRATCSASSKRERGVESRPPWLFKPSNASACANSPQNLPSNCPPSRTSLPPPNPASLNSPNEHHPPLPPKTPNPRNNKPLELPALLSLPTSEF